MYIFSLVAIAAILPCFLCQVNVMDPLCKDVTCPNGEICRHFKPCGVNENCNVTVTCTATRAARGGCKFGDPVLFNNNGKIEDLTCHNAAPCPGNAYCSTLLQDVSAVCCLSDPANTVKSDYICPVINPDPTRHWCVDECKSDGDCQFLNEKCCFTGCSKGCIHSEIPKPPGELLPPLQQGPLTSLADPCQGKNCPFGQVCRHFKPCKLIEKCNITAICTTGSSDKFGCMHSSPILFNNDKGQQEDLYCYREAPCPDNAYCSTVLMDTHSRCCLTDPEKRVKPGVCPLPNRRPVTKNDLFFCYDECKNDGDCGWNTKCCNTGCKLECVPPKKISILIPPTPPTITIMPNMPGRPSYDPCDNKNCPSGQVCRHFKPCKLMEKCDITAICTTKPSYRYGCMHSSPILFNNDKGQQENLYCYREAPCPDNAYCSTVLMDTSSRCCLTDPERRVKPGVCPHPNRRPITKNDLMFCYDECKNDGDCSWDTKCCNTGCKLECVPPKKINILIQPTPPTITIRPPVRPLYDPCDNKLCPANMYCRRVGEPCRETWSCRPEGECNRCPFIALPRRSSGFRVITDPDGCPAVVRRQRQPHPYHGLSRMPSYNLNPFNMMLLYDLFQKK